MVDDDCATAWTAACFADCIDSFTDCAVRGVLNEHAEPDGGALKEPDVPPEAPKDLIPTRRKLSFAKSLKKPGARPLDLLLNALVSVI